MLARPHSFSVRPATMYSTGINRSSTIDLTRVTAASVDSAGSSFNLTIDTSLNPNPPSLKITRLNRLPKGAKMRVPDDFIKVRGVAATVLMDTVYAKWQKAITDELAAIQKAEIERRSKIHK